MSFPGHFRIPGHSGTDFKHRKGFAKPKEFLQKKLRIGGKEANKEVRRDADKVRKKLQENLNLKRQGKIVSGIAFLLFFLCFLFILFQIKAAF